MASLKRAVDLDVDIIETDVQLTRDDVPIIRHDRLLDRTTNTSGYTTAFTWAEYEASIRLNNGEKVPSLEDYCKFLSGKRQKLYLDVKTFGNEAAILDICQKHLPTDQFYFGSFHNHSIKLVKSIDPSVKTILIMDGNPIDIQMVVENAGCDIMALGFDTLEEDVVSLVQELGKQVFTWTVNDSREIIRAKNLGVDGIVSDFPDRI
jgi:glycerophosphoryl diester phosphodiesterase